VTSVTVPTPFVRPLPVFVRVRSIVFTASVMARRLELRVHEFVDLPSPLLVRMCPDVFRPLSDLAAPLGVVPGAFVVRDP